MLIQLNKLTKSYKMGDVTLEILRGISLTIKAGEYISIMGPSGSGKSTLMHIMGCLDQPTSGEYILDNTELSKINNRQLSEIRRNKIGFIFQTFNLIPKLTALGNVMLPLIYNRKKDTDKRALKLLERVGLGHRTGHFPNQLSGGERQRVAIARALINDPDIMMLDEPTGNLDSVSGKQVMQIIEELKEENKTIILVTHDRLVAEQAEKIIHIKDGQILKVES